MFERQGTKPKKSPV